jgi:hypothetical protein
MRALPILVRISGILAVLCGALTAAALNWWIAIVMAICGFRLLTMDTTALSAVPRQAR